MLSLGKSYFYHRILFYTTLFSYVVCTNFYFRMENPCLVFLILRHNDPSRLCPRRDHLRCVCPYADTEDIVGCGECRLDNVDLSMTNRLYTVSTLGMAIASLLPKNKNRHIQVMHYGFGDVAWQDLPPLPTAQFESCK